MGQGDENWTRSGPSCSRAQCLPPQENAKGREGPSLPAAKLQQNDVEEKRPSEV